MSNDITYEQLIEDLRTFAPRREALYEPDLPPLYLHIYRALQFLYAPMLGCWSADGAGYRAWMGWDDDDSIACMQVWPAGRLGIEMPGKSPEDRPLPSPHTRYYEPAEFDFANMYKALTDAGFHVDSMHYSQRQDEQIEIWWHSHKRGSTCTEKEPEMAQQFMLQVQFTVPDEDDDDGEDG